MMGRLVAALFIIVLLTLPAAAETGLASFYGSESGNRTANGERFHPERISCAHRHHAFGTMLRVTDLETGRSVICRVNDRGPARWTGRIVDLSLGAARQLNMVTRGVIRVRIEVLR